MPTTALRAPRRPPPVNRRDRSKHRPDIASRFREAALKNTVAKLLIDAGKACAAYHDANVRHVKSARVQVGEIWSFTYAKQKNVATAKDAPEGAGDTWTWTVIDAEYAIAFIQDLAERVMGRFSSPAMV